MTPKFITPCFVHIEDKAYREKVLRELDELGYACACVGYGNDAIVSTHDAGYSVDYRPVQSDIIDCGTNTELFLALAGMRDDTDKGQWWWDEDNNRPVKFQTLFSPQSLRAKCFRKATAQEIVEHFSKETK